MHVIIILIVLYLLYLAVDAYRTNAARRKLRHIVHVNGIRGKSSVARLIHAGLKAGGVPSLCKVTGTDPMILNPDGSERILLRIGKANIREQAHVLRLAAREKASVLVIECMAITPELQRASQHSILKADIGVLTNVRRDHTDVMGETLEEICDSLLNAAPTQGVLFTAEREFLPRIRTHAEKADTRLIQACPGEAEYDFDFAENVELALSVCEYLGVDRKTALSGMRSYSRDHYALSMHPIGNQVFINALSVNDPDSTVAVWHRLREKLPPDMHLVLLINNRPDRGSRAQDMLRVCQALQPDEVILFGAAQAYMRAQLNRMCPEMPVHRKKKAADLDFANYPGKNVFFAVGNLKGVGRDLLEKAGREGKHV